MHAVEVFGYYGGYYTSYTYLKNHFCPEHYPVPEEFTDPERYYDNCAAMISGRPGQSLMNFKQNALFDYSRSPNYMETYRLAQKCLFSVMGAIALYFWFYDIALKQKHVIAAVSLISIFIGLPFLWNITQTEGWDFLSYFE